MPRVHCMLLHSIATYTRPCTIAPQLMAPVAADLAGRLAWLGLHAVSCTCVQPACHAPDLGRLPALDELQECILNSTGSDNVFCGKLSCRGDLRGCIMGCGQVRWQALQLPPGEVLLPAHLMRGCAARCELPCD